jgi:DNA polymerase
MTTIDNCPDCPYREYGRAVGHRGNPASPFVLVGEAPGTTEIEMGRPFVGPAGTRVLWPAVMEAGLSDTNLFVTNSVACLPRPVKPHVAAIKACHERLARDLGAHHREVIVALGATAIRAVTGLREFPITKAGARAELQSDWGKVVPTFHPAYILRRGLKGQEMRRLVADLEHARRFAGL